MSTDSVATIWERIASHLAKHQPAVLAALSGPATEGELAKAEAELGFSLPAAFRETLLIHNGAQESPCFFGAYWFMDITNIVSHYKETKERFAKEIEFNDECPWTTMFVAFGNEHSYKDLLFLDTATGAVYRYSETEWDKWSDDFGRWLEGIASDLEAQRIVWDERDSWFARTDGGFMGEPPQDE